MMENMLQVHFRGFSRLVTLESNNLFITIKQAVIYFATVMLVEVGNCASNGKTQKSRDSKNTWHFGTRRDAKGLMFSPMRAGDKKSLLRETPCPLGHPLLYKFPVIKPPAVFK